MIRALTALAAALFMSGASAQVMTPCVPRDALVAMVLEKWGEVPVLAGIVNQGQLAMEFLVGPKRTWTVIHIQPLGDCAWIVSAGRDLMIMGDVPPAGQPLEWSSLPVFH